MRERLRALWQPIAGAVLFLLFILGLALIALPQSCASPKAPVAASPTATSTVAARAAPPPATPAPTSSPYAVAPPAMSLAATPGPGSKNFDGDPPPTPMAPGTPLTGVLLATGSIVACGSNANSDWITTADNFQVICQCTLTMPCAGWAFISADGSVAGRNCEYEAQFRLGIDQAGGDPATDRWVNVYADTGDGMDAVVAISALKPLPAGTHTFYLLGRRSGGAGPVLVHDASLTVLAFPVTAP